MAAFNGPRLQASRHGKFRPTLMNLVKSNPASSASVIHDAVGKFRASKDVDAAVTALCKLRGIGPATASLLLSVHDTGVIFFSDEAFWWLCRGGKKDSIKYTAAEYRELRRDAKALCKRLSVDAVDVEKAAYVLMKEGLDSKPTDAKTKSEKPKVPQPKDAKGPVKPQPKRKVEAEHPESTLRRSKRHT